MKSAWRRLQSKSIWLRWPIKWAIFAVVLFVVLYPNPAAFVRHIQHIRHLDTITNPNDPAAAPVIAEFEAYLSRSAATGSLNEQQRLLKSVEAFVNQRIPYAWDWDVWGVADYLPTLSELLEKGREDCDGRAVLAATLLRSRGIDARLVGDVRHIWVKTPIGETMNPLGPPVFQRDSSGWHVRWLAALDPGPLAFGISVFPFGREVIILLATWVLLLPLKIKPATAALTLFLLVEALVILRLAGADPRVPHYGGIAWGWAHVLAGGVFVMRSKTQKDRPVGF